jgi:RNA polymerase sigma-70 factor, ECF subfamily
MTITRSEWAKPSSAETRQDMDQALVAAAQAGSAAAFEALHERHARAIYRVTLSITKNASDAEDVMQDSFMRAYFGLKYFRQEAQFFSWLMRIAINSSLMFLRKRRRERELSMQDYSDCDNDIMEIDFVDMRPNPEGILHHKQTYAGVEGSVEVLPKHLRTVAELRFLQEQSIQEISAVLGISNATAKSRLHRARKLMALKGLKLRLRQQPA